MDEMSFVCHSVHSRMLTRTRDLRIVRGSRVIVGGDGMLCDVGRVEICVRRRVEMSGGRISCAIAIDRRMAKMRKRNPAHTFGGIRLAEGQEMKTTQQFGGDEIWTV